MNSSRSILAERALHSTQRRVLSALAVLACTVGVTTSAVAGEPPPAGGGVVSATGDEPSADAKAHAQKLFEDAVKMTETGMFKEACPLFAASLRLDSGIGTLLYLADCQEQVGQTASAWAGFKEAVDLAKRKNQPDREKIARERAAKLEPKLSMLKIDVDEKTRALGVTVKRNGVVVADAIWGSYLPVDPGTQELEASAPGYETWKSTTEVPVGPARTEATIPALTQSHLPGPTPVPVGGGSSGFAMRIAGISLGGAGVVGLAIGTGFGVDAMGSYSDARDTCVNDDPTRCTPAGVELQRSASTSALVSTVAFSVGATALVGGALLFFLAPDDGPAPQVGVSFDQRGAFFTFGGAL